jgi:hypothetical protein
MFSIKKFLSRKFTLSMPVMLVGLAAVLIVSMGGYGLAWSQHLIAREAFENASGGVEGDGDSNADSPMSFEEFLKQQKPGIPASQIPAGEEDKYIRKSEIVPPVCPKCPDVSVCEKAAKCPPCPPCARCPEPAFDCKKVPNYSRPSSGQYLPKAVISDFSAFS